MIGDSKFCLCSDSVLFLRPIHIQSTFTDKHEATLCIAFNCVYVRYLGLELILE